MDEALNGSSHDASDLSAMLMRQRTALLAFILASVRNYHDAEEILQEVCVVVCRKADQFKPGTNFLAWVRTIAARTMLSYRRRNHKTIAVDPHVLEGLNRGAESREREARNLAERIHSLNQCLKRLPSRLRKLLQFHYQDQLSIETIAERGGREVGAVYKALLRTRASLRECVQRQLMRG